MSFGFKYGKPEKPPLGQGATSFADCRKIRNPWKVPGMRKLTGLDPTVQALVGGCKTAKKKLKLQLVFCKAYNTKETNLYVRAGCTGGKHRSVAFIELLAQELEKAGIDYQITHRDLYANTQYGPADSSNGTSEESKQIEV